VIPVETIGTDPTLATFRPEKDAEYYEKSWLFNEESPSGERYSKPHEAGYQAPPLDGVWATAPYFHNGSVPTIYHVLNSKARPAIYTRAYAAEEEDFDQVNLGWTYNALDEVPDNLSTFERRKICDTSQTGRGNGGHIFGDTLSEEERSAVIEYLKTF